VVGVEGVGGPAGGKAAGRLAIENRAADLGRISRPRDSLRGGGGGGAAAGADFADLGRISRARDSLRGGGGGAAGGARAAGFVGSYAGPAPQNGPKPSLGSWE
jgi:hypothetical protein